ncbi:MAG TPA: patatin-like phospholipase family protein [Sporosarcina sp.]|nr:patatin-like phospholipase family protein [Sporosarcina sp.]
MKIDGVFSGGGLKGYALLGAYAALEERGYQFERVAGTSAGAIVASFIAAGYTAAETERLLDELDPSMFLDARTSMIPHPIVKWLRLYWKMGLYKGNALENWFLEKLAYKGVYTFGDLPPNKLTLVASDLTHQKILVLPDDLPTYGIDPQSFPIARALRMSCGIPYVFEPVTIRNKQGETVIVDGGLLSNFPIWLFQNGKRSKSRPVIGLKLSSKMTAQKSQPIRNALQLFEALFSTMKNAHDERYISRTYEKNIVFIPVEHYRATDFHMEDETKHQLFEVGKHQTEKFLSFW